MKYLTSALLIAALTLASMEATLADNGAAADLAPRLTLEIRGGQQADATSWKIEVGTYFDLEVRAPEEGQTMLLVAPLLQPNQIKYGTAQIAFQVRSQQDLLLRNLILDPSLADQAFVVQALFVSQSGTVLLSDVINVYVTPKESGGNPGNPGDTGDDPDPGSTADKL